MAHSAYGIPISWFLTVGAMLFCIGIFGMMTRRSAIGMLLSIEVMLNAANINLIAFGSYLKTPQIAGQVFAIFVIAIAAAETAVGLAIVINIYRSQQHIDADKIYRDEALRVNMNIVLTKLNSTQRLGR